MLDVALTEPQELFAFSEAPFPALVGGLGSGKSRGGTFRIVRLLLEDPGADGAYYMPTYDLLRLRAMSGVEEELEALGLSYRTNRSEFTIKIDGYGSIIFRSYEKPERIVAYEVAHSIVDELDTLPKEKARLVWRKVAERNRQKRGRPNSIGVVTTPDQGVNGFVCDNWEKKKRPEYPLFRASTRSNPFLPAGYVQQILDNYDPILAELYIEGAFVSLSEKKVYHYFKRGEHHTDRVLRDTDRNVYVSIDFNVGGCCSVVFVIDGDEPRAVDEFVSFDTADFCIQLHKRFKGRNVVVHPDASGAARTTNASQSDIAMIEAAGYRVDAPLANPAVRDRINAVNSGLAHGKFLVNTAKCPNFTHSLESQGYTVKGEPEKFDDHPSIDDWNDSAGYFISKRWPVRRPIANVEFSFPT